jgi:hypothetical protein
MNGIAASTKRARLAHAEREQAVGEAEPFPARLLLHIAAELQHLDHAVQLAARPVEPLGNGREGERLGRVGKQLEDIEPLFQRRRPIAPVVVGHVLAHSRPSLLNKRAIVQRPITWTKAPASCPVGSFPDAESRPVRSSQRNVADRPPPVL